MESGFIPGCAYLIGSYYKKDEFLVRYCWFFSMGILAGAFNGVSGKNRPRQLDSMVGADRVSTASGDFVLDDEGGRRLFRYDQRFTRPEHHADLI